MTHLASITLGSNIGDKVFNIKKAIDYVSKSWKLKGFQITMKQSHGAMKAKIHLLMRGLL